MTSAPSRVFACPPFPLVELDGSAGYWKGEIALGQETLAISLYVDASLSDEVLASAAGQLTNLTTVRELGIKGGRPQTSA